MFDFWWLLKRQRQTSNLSIEKEKEEIKTSSLIKEREHEDDDYTFGSSKGEANDKMWNQRGQAGGGMMPTTTGRGGGGKTIPIQGRKTGGGGGGTMPDLYYRYTMPALCVEQQGGGGGKKSSKNSIRIVNIDLVAKALQRSPQELAKFFQSELACAVSYRRTKKNKHHGNNRAGNNAAAAAAAGELCIKTGAVQSVSALQEVLKLYIDDYVLCHHCCLPETKYKFVVEDGTAGAAQRRGKRHGNISVVQDCQACGTHSLIDVERSVGKWICKEHYKQQSKHGSRRGKEKKEVGDDNEKEQMETSSWVLLAENPMMRQEEEVVEEVGIGLADKELKLRVAWDSDTDDATALDISVKKFRKWLKRTMRKKEHELSPINVVNELTNLQVAALLPSTDRIVILMRAVLRRKYSWADWKNRISQVVGPVLSLLVCGSPLLERHVLAVLEWTCRRTVPERFAATALLLYEEENVLEAETILQWARDVDHGVRVYPRDLVNNEDRIVLRQEAEPLVIWLLRDDESDEDEDEDEYDAKRIIED